MSVAAADTPPGRAPGTRTWLACLALIVLVAGALRIHGIAYGLPALVDPDELIFIGGAHQLIASGVGNPGWFGHPATTTIYVLGLVAGVILASGLASGRFQTPDDFVQAMFFDPGMVVLPARVVMALFGVACVVLTWRLASRLAGRWGGLVAGALMAVNPVLVTWSQVVRSDMMALTFLLLAAHAGERLLHTGKRRYLAWACLATALAITSKWPFAVAFLIIAAVLALRHRGSGAGWARLVATIAASGFAVLVLVVAISPFLVLDYPTLLSNLQGEAKVGHLGGMRGGVWGNLVYYFGEPIWQGLGAVGALLAAGGLVLARRNAAFWALAGVPAAVMLALILSQSVVWERWAIPLFPALAIAAGFAAEWIIRRATLPSAPAAALAIGTFAAMTVPLVRADLALANERIHDNRKLASDWTRANLPRGSTILFEHFAFDMLSSPYDFMFPIGKAGCVDPRAVLRGTIDYKTVDSLRGGQSNLDYAAVPDDMRATCNPDFAVLTEHARYFADAAVFPEGARRYRELIARGRIIKRFPRVAGKVGGRPEVIVLDLRKP